MSLTQFLWESYLSIPIVTRVCSTFTVILAMAVEMELVSNYDCYFNPWLTFGQFQVWRLVTCFFYIERIDITFIFNLLFPYRYCWALESIDFNDKTEDFVVMMLFGMSFILMLGYLAGSIWLNHSLSLFILYIWSRRNPTVRVELFGLLVFPAAFIPIVFFAMSLLFANPASDLIGYLAGHIYYHAYFVFPHLPHGFHVLRSPEFLKQWFHPPEIDEPIEHEVVREPPPQMRDASTSTFHDINSSTSRSSVSGNVMEPEEPPQVTPPTEKTAISET